MADGITPEGSFSVGTFRGKPAHFKYAFTARIRLLQLVALSPASRFLMTNPVKSFCVGLSMRGQLKLSRYHSIVRGLTFVM